MKRLLTTLIILLVVIITGLAALVMLVNPNDFRAYMVKQVQKKSGYQLVLQDGMRWHVWPKLSIITGRMSLTAPGAAQPTVMAENMRLDVALWPLLSHQLAVKEVMLKGAILRVTPESQSQKKGNTPIAPTGSTANPVAKGEGWELDIARVKIADSLLIWQRDDHEQLNVRDINLLMERDNQNHISVELSSKVSKNQQDLAFNLNADVDITDYPYRVAGNIDFFDYQLQGAGIPTGGISGSGKVHAVYQKETTDELQTISLQALSFTANESELHGSIKAMLGAHADYRIDLSSQKLNLDNLMGWDLLPKEGSEVKRYYRIENSSAKPVIAVSSSAEPDYSAAFLNDFNANVTINADKFVYRGMEIDNLILKATNNSGIAEISTLNGKLFGGDFSIPVILDATGNQLKLHAKPLLRNIELEPVLKAFSLPPAFSGKFDLNGDLSGKGYDGYAISHIWQGDLNFSLVNAKMYGLNIPQLIQQSVARATDKVNIPDNMDNFTRAKKLDVKAVLNRGDIKISRLHAVSDLLNIDGQGKTNLLKQDVDVALKVQITQGWGKDNELVSRLRKMKVPLRVYGNWSNLQYNLDIEQLLHNELENKVKQAINDWVERSSN
ncbi:outer membrane assembly protein AsmA [Photorhabdus laumondii subsp. laumondii]|uniref:Protein AsmA n=4 Tax=Photorhabdus TaxID=29487 RepID=Q7N6J2_PHOLL|nr:MULTISPECIES: outer membrane assembly protein AsmA [Photorhabdus]RAW74199.1 outer membrane assembly protein AsmA [Photorhabdus sp. S14-60]AWK41412.1 outer membrane assembly protein AsmA [Photorhabdus laumondii subsp. laumondii]AXG42142.1 outer membrane assembly protein AsmA [Photorhabdus laumondii subsp. laumondii]AXG46734.1 outer membrane assembly protein AsmA [Photorhabdus laumondii subsp. laumondii]KTL61112.1 membrane assembly protein AsmA [Photorhabdus laumondii subsp. laumondii]